MRVKNQQVPVGFKERADQLFFNRNRKDRTLYGKPYTAALCSKNTNQAGKSRKAGLHIWYEWRNGRWWTCSLQSNGYIFRK